MRLHQFALLTLSLLGLSGTALAEPWAIDASHSSVGFSVRHMMISNTTGEFTEFEGQFDINENNLTKSTVNLSIAAKSVDTRDKKRDEHLRGADFFDVAKHPAITFKSTAIKKAGKKFNVTGNLTMHGVTKQVTILVALTKAVATPFGTTARGATVVGKVNRKDFGIVWNKSLDAGGLAVGEEVALDINLELTKK